MILVSVFAGNNASAKITWGNFISWSFKTLVLHSITIDLERGSIRKIFSCGYLSFNSFINSSREDAERINFLLRSLFSENNFSTGGEIFQLLLAIEMMVSGGSAWMFLALIMKRFSPSVRIISREWSFSFSDFII